MSEPHPDFTATGEDHRWTRPLHELAVRLREGAWKLKGQWAWYVLPGGARVEMRVVPDGEHAFRKELRISRSQPLPDTDAAKKWAAECKVFRAHLGCDLGWQTQTFGGRPKGEAFQDGDPTEWITRENAPLGLAQTPENKCRRCGKPAPHQPEFKEDLCTTCAMELGNEEVAARRAEQATLDLPPYPGGGEIERPGGEPT